MKKIFLRFLEVLGRDVRRVSSALESNSRRNMAPVGMERWSRSADGDSWPEIMARFFRPGRDSTRPRGALDESGIEWSSTLQSRGAFAKKSRSCVIDIPLPGTRRSTKVLSFERLHQGEGGMTPDRLSVRNDGRSPLKSFSSRAIRESHLISMSKSVRRGRGVEKHVVEYLRRCSCPMM